MKTFLAIALLAAVLPAQAGICRPPLDPNTWLPRAATNENTKGCWVGWRCPDRSLYVAAAIKSKCGLVGTRRAVMAWLKDPQESALTFGAPPATDAALREVWVPDRATLDALP